MSTLLEVFQHCVETVPGQTVYLFLDQRGVEASSLTYSQLDLQARARAEEIRQNAGSGNRVMILLPTGPEFVISILACFYAGAVAVPTDCPRPGRSPDLLIGIIEDCRPTLLISSCAVLEGLTFPGSPPQLLVDSPGVVAPKLCSLRHRALPSDLALLQYTSGSTARPKGVKITHSNLFNNLSTIRTAMALPDLCTGVSWLPLTHDMGLIGTIFGVWMVRGRSVLMAPQTFLGRPRLWLECISRYSAYVSGGPNFAYDLCLRKISAAQREGLDLRSWQVAFCGAEPVRWETMRRFRAFFAVCGLPVHAIYPCYGLAEATLFVAGPEPRRDLLTVTVDPEPLTRGQVVLQHQPGLPSRTYVSCGRSWDGQQLTILPTSTIRNECQGDIVYSGEICISGSSISSGYWGDIAPAGPLLRTGDLGFIHLGALYITGRLKDTLVVNGRNFCAEDIEHALQGCHPEARPNGICAFNDHNEQPVIVCETRLAGARQEELAYALREGLARYCDLVPSCVFFVKPGWLPRTATGKLQRSLALQRYLDVRRHSEESTPGNFAGQSHKDPAGFRSRQNLSELLKTRIAHELGVEASTLDYARTFDELGLSSVSRLALAAVLAEDLGRELPPDLTWVYPTLEDLVAALLPAPGPIPLSEESIHQRTIQELHFGSMPPLIVVQDLLGGPSWFRPALSCWPGPAAVWGLRQITEQEDFQAPESLSDLAAQYCGSLMERRLTSYRLVGYSHCCRLALELARQLTQRGATVDFLGLVDGFPGHWLDVPPKELGTLLKREAIKIMEFLLRGQKGEAWRSLTGSVTWLKRFFLHKAGYVDRGDRWKAGLPFPKSLNVELCEKHIPQPFSGKITFFRRSFGGICVQFTPDGGWAGLAKGGVETVEVGGNHDTMMKHPHVHILVDRLARECP